MEKFKKVVVIGFVWAVIGGLLLGMLDVDAILVSSKHDLGSIPYLSWVSVSWVLLLGVLLMLAWFGVWLWLVGWLLAWMDRDFDLEKKTLVALGGGGALFGVVLGFMGSGAVGLLSWVKVLGLSVGIGVLVGFVIWIFIDWMEVRGFKWEKWWLMFSWLVGVVFTVVVLVVIFQGIRVLSKGRVNQVMEGAGGEGKNLILITMEAWREDDFNDSLMGSLSRWSEEALVFEKAYSPAPWTLPSFASMMSGYYPGQLGVSTTDYSVDEIKYGGRLVEEVETLAERLGSEGYLTQGFLTNEWLSRERGFGQGMEGVVQLEVQRPYHYVFHGKDMSLVQWYKRLGLEKEVIKGWDFLVGEASLHKWGTDAEQVVGLGRNWLLKEPVEPFFLWMHLMDPHAPYQPEERYGPEATEVAEEKIRELQELRPLDREKIRWREIDKKVYKELYQGELKYVDENLVSRFLKRVEEWGYLDDSVVVITSDHGEEFWEHGGLGHATTLYDEQVRVPLMVRAPEQKPDIRDDVVSLVDLKYSMLDILDIEESDRSWWSDNYENRVWLEGNGRGPYLKAVVEDGWKLIWNMFEDSYELYDLRVDEGEKNNVVNKYVGVTARLKKLLQEHVEENEEFYQRLDKGEVKEGLGDVVGY